VQGRWRTPHCQGPPVRCSSSPAASAPAGTVPGDHNNSSSQRFGNDDTQTHHAQLWALAACKYQDKTTTQRGKESRARGADGVGARRRVRTWARRSAPCLYCRYALARQQHRSASDLKALSAISRSGTAGGTKDTYVDNTRSNSSTNNNDSTHARVRLTNA
jgi:hypothetical protein